MAKKTHIRVRIPVEFDAALQRVMPHLAGSGMAEARVFGALGSFFVDRNVSIPSAPRPASLDRPASAPRVKRERVSRMRPAKPTRMRKARRG